MKVIYFKMETRPLGNTDVNVPTVGMGTFQTFDVSGRRAEKHCRRIVDTALSVGTTLFDSSPMYGESERVLAQAIQGKRQQAIIATKVWSGSVAEGRRQIEQALVVAVGRALVDDGADGRLAHIFNRAQAKPNRFFV